jgi:S1-C subfamily serine protease
MALRFICPYCKSPNAIDASMQGHNVRCGKCRKLISVPAAETPKKKSADEQVKLDKARPKLNPANSNGKNTGKKSPASPPKPTDQPARKRSFAVSLFAVTALFLCFLGSGGIAGFFLVPWDRLLDDKSNQQTKFDPRTSEDKKAKIEALGDQKDQLDPIQKKNSDQKPEPVSAKRKDLDPALNKKPDPIPVKPKDPDPELNKKSDPDPGKPKDPDPELNKNLDPFVDPNAGKPLPDQITPETVQSVKQATVYLRVTLPGGQVAEGSGFFALEPGIVITNAHVLGMLQSSNRPPKQVDVVLNSGEPNERKMIGEVLGVDRDSDLAVVRVAADNLPAPLKLGDDQKLFETQKVYIFGFPFGEKLGKNITVSPSAVSSLRKEPKTGLLEQIQVNGGMHPGNSGGPVVNAAGTLAGISVAGISGTQINFAVPSVKVRMVMEGRFAETLWGEPYGEKANPRLPVQYKCLDPLNRIQEMHVELWTGSPGTGRPYSFEQPRPQPGDSDRQSHVIVYRDGVGRIDVPLPDLPAGQVYWLQPVIKTAKGVQWGPAQATSTNLAFLERAPADLTVSFMSQKERTSKMVCTYTNTLSVGKKKLVRTDKTMVELFEVVHPEESKGKAIAKLRTAFGPLSISMDRDGRRIPIPEEPQAMAAVRSMPPIFVVDNTNSTHSYIKVSLNPKHPLVEIVDELNGMVHNPYEAATIQMPNKVVQPLETFPAKSTMLLRTDGKSIIVDLMMTCTYEGKRRRDGRDEAIITVVGQLQGRKELVGRIEGNITGKVGFDLVGGFLSLVQLKTVADNEEIIEGIGTVRRVMLDEIEMTRVPGNRLSLQLAVEKSPGPALPPLGKTLVNLTSALTMADAFETTPALREKNARMKIHFMPMEAGKTYVISMNSAVIDSYLRLEDPTGKQVAEDDDGGGFPNARIVYRAAQAGVHRIIATSFDGKLGPYQLIVQAGQEKEKDKGTAAPPLGMAFNKPAKSETPTNYLKVSSTQGDPIAQGKTLDYRANQLTVKRISRGLRISVDGWTLDFGAPTGQFLQVGEYPNAKVYAFSAASPGLDFYGKGRGSNKTVGEFAVWEMEMKGDQVVRLAIDFVVRADEKSPPIIGKVRINSSLQ